MSKIKGPDLRAVLDSARREGPSPYLKQIVKKLEAADKVLNQHYDYLRSMRTRMRKPR